MGFRCFTAAGSYVNIIGGLFGCWPLLKEEEHIGTMITVIMNRDEDNPYENPAREEGPDTGVLLKARPKTQKPAMYKVLILNDDYTPMEFVVHVLEKFFAKSREQATEIMMHVHRKGVGICGVYTFEIAETKVAQVMEFARNNEQPLQCTMEQE